MGSSSGETSQQLLGPGFRFHPTDEELVRYYLKRKVCGKPLFYAISEIDIYGCEPWDLPSLSRLRTRDREWYFFSALDKKYGCSSRANRATLQGYWKTTGKDRAVYHKSCIVGMKKTLVFHVGRAPRGERTNWVMHEYRLKDDDLATAGTVQDAFVLCRIYQKSGSGPKNGEQYGAPFVEEEWDDDVLVPKKEIGDENPLSVVAEPGSVQEPDDYEQHPDVGIKDNCILPVVETDGHDSSINLDCPMDFLEDMLVGINENCYSTESPHRQEFLEVTVEKNNSTEMQDYAVFCGGLGENTHLEEPLQNYPPVKDGSYLELDDIVNPLELNDRTGEVDDNQFYFDAPDHDQPLNGDGSFLEMNDLLNRSEFGTADDWLEYFDATDYNMALVESGNYLLDQQPVFTSEVDAGTAPASSQALKAIGVEDASNQKLEACGGSKDNNISDTRYEESWDKSLAKRFTNMLGSIPSPPAFAAEYPIEASIKSVGQNSASHSGSVHVSAGMFFVSGGLRLTGNDKQWSVQKGGNVGFVLSYGMSAVDATTTETISEVPGRAMSIIWPAGLCLCFILVPILVVSFKFGTYIFS